MTGTSPARSRPSRRAPGGGRVPACSLVLCAVSVFGMVCSGCGVKGSPIPPEEIGIRAKLLEAEGTGTPPQPEDVGDRAGESGLPDEAVKEGVVLPPLAPIGAAQ